MNKQELITKVEGKLGFHSIAQDTVAPDNIAGDPIEKRYLVVNVNNADGTMGKTFVFYLYDTANDIASFYNTETEALDIKEPTSNQKKLDALQAYLGTNFDAYFVGRYDLQNNWAEADVFKLTTGKLVKSSVIVFKKGTNPINHLVVV